MCMFIYFDCDEVSWSCWNDLICSLNANVDNKGSIVWQILFSIIICIFASTWNAYRNIRRIQMNLFIGLKNSSKIRNGFSCQHVVFPPKPSSQGEEFGCHLVWQMQRDSPVLCDFACFDCFHFFLFARHIYLQLKSRFLLFHCNFFFLFISTHRFNFDWNLWKTVVESYALTTVNVRKTF